MTAFVLLHYRAIHNTTHCVDCIRALEGAKHIVIVDNASPDATGLELYRMYRGCKDVTVLLNGENSGFARGNNLGIAWAVNHLNPAFTVVLNDDVEIRQPNFIPELYRIEREHPFDLLGPDIVSVFSGIHQSPKRLRGYDAAQVENKLAYVRRSQHPILMLLSSGEKNSPALWRLIQRRNRARQHIDSGVAMEGVVLHGSCVIFARRYLRGHPEPFYPGTFMYFEMEILEWLCRREGCVLRYDPAVTVRHYQYGSTRLAYRSILKRSRFVASCLEDSLLAALNLMRQEEGKDAAHGEEEKTQA